jgi:hypothetical protein
MRKYTDMILDGIEEGILNKNDVILACLKYMSEDAIKAMAIHNEFFEVNEVVENTNPFTTEWETRLTCKNKSVISRLCEECGVEYIKEEHKEDCQIGKDE